MGGYEMDTIKQRAATLIDELELELEIFAATGILPIDVDRTKVKIQNYSRTSNGDKVRAAEKMYGTGSRQHLQALRRFL